jgi:hypothetical protein
MRATSFFKVISLTVLDDMDDDAHDLLGNFDGILRQIEGQAIPIEFQEFPRGAGGDDAMDALYFR